MSLTTDPNDPRLGRGVDDKPVPQNEAYLVLSDEERAKGFVRPVRTAYVHVGPPGPRFPLVDLDPERDHVGNYVKFEPYPEGAEPSMALGRYWTQAQLDRAGKGCQTSTTMAQAIAETYARDPRFYGATYCVACRRHLPVGSDGEFVWLGTQERVGT